ncbi:Protein TIC 40, chloroplastic [Datura stramonium]|uniref:Protein TIC 40, chloroplastic n=1 Tax=Datura stramonium TaxID=4076 RepID=A0ABS8URP2_DATST|nr:Protein TIC 40, chloroplastic [Datura stramonium]
MENIGIVSSPKMVLGLSSNPRNPVISSKPFFSLPHLPKRPSKNGRIVRPTTCFEVVSCFQGPRLTKKIVLGKLGRDSFASTTTSGGQQTSSVGVNPQFSAPSPSSQVGSPLFWIGVGVGLSALFSWKYAMQQAFKTMMGQMNSQNSQFSNTAFSPGSPFPFPPPPLSGPASSSPPPPTASTLSTPSASFAPQPVTVDVSATKVEEPPAVNVKNDTEAEKGPKKNAFVDISPDETFQKGAFENYKESTETASVTVDQVTQNGAASQSGFGANTSDNTSSTGKSNPLLSVDALEKMMEDPTVQKMVYPYLPEEMRNPTTFKWMLQNPQYRQQLQEMMNNMGGNPEWDNRMMDSLKNFDLSSPEIKQQFDQIGLTPEEVISKIMANPDVAMAFQNPSYDSESGSKVGVKSRVPFRDKVLSQCQGRKLSPGSRSRRSPLMTQNPQSSVEISTGLGSSQKNGKSKKSRVAPVEEEELRHCQ